VTRSIFPLVSLLVVLAAAATAQDFAQIPVRTTQLAPGTHLVQGAGGNMLACAGPQGLLVVDADYLKMSAKLVAPLDSLGAGPCRLVVNTHWHFDHVGGNAALAAAGAIVMGHANTRRHMSAAQHLDVIDQDVAASSPEALPCEIVNDSLVIQWGDETVLLRHVPAAHTDGDLVVHLRRADVVHTGDLCFNGGYPYIDTAHGGTIDGVLAGLDVVLSLAGPATRIVPGHGPVATRDELAAYRDALQRFRDLVVAEMEAGRTLAEVQAAKPTAELDAIWGRRMFPPDAFTELVFRSFGRE
jgi:glyoxylase-like metal-dependent hydrolase (beta-lactamase superfamily II)